MKELSKLAAEKPESCFGDDDYIMYFNSIMMINDIADDFEKFAMKELYPLLTN